MGDHQSFVLHPLESLGSLPEAKREAEEIKESKGSDDSCLGNVSGSHGNLEISLLEIKLRKELGVKDLGGEIRNGG